MFINYYEILGVAMDATEIQIKKAYRLNAIKFHPDKHFGDAYFAQKFLEVKDAYDTLIDEGKRREYDLLNQPYFQSAKSTSNAGTSKEENFQNESKKNQEKQKQEDEKFRYDPYKQFYSSLDREQQDTPQFHPIYDFWGQKLSEDTDFFILPKNIGKIVGALSDLKKNEQPVGGSQKTMRKLVGLLIGLTVSTIIYFAAQLKDTTWIVVWFVAPPLLALLIVLVKNSFLHKNYFVGVNGFAEFVCRDNRENITESKEVNFNEVTDLFSYYVEHKTNYVYKHTEYVYRWFDRNTGNIAHSSISSFDKNDELQSNRNAEINLARTAERYWTVYLLDRMEETLQKNNHILFCLYDNKQNSFFDYIKLGVGTITFIKTPTEEFTYKFNDIKKMYMKGSELRIQHKNFEKTLFFFKSGNEDVIPMTNLCNRQFFIKAMELLLGYSIG